MLSHCLPALSLFQGSVPAVPPDGGQYSTLAASPDGRPGASVTLHAATHGPLATSWGTAWMGEAVLPIWASRVCVAQITEVRTLFMLPDAELNIKIYILHTTHI